MNYGGNDNSSTKKANHRIVTYKRYVLRRRTLDKVDSLEDKFENEEVAAIFRSERGTAFTQVDP